MIVLIVVVFFVIVITYFFYNNGNGNENFYPVSYQRVCGCTNSFDLIVKPFPLVGSFYTTEKPLLSDEQRSHLTPEQKNSLDYSTNKYDYFKAKNHNVLI